MKTLLKILSRFLKPNKQRKIRGRTFGFDRKLRILNSGRYSR